METVAAVIAGICSLLSTYACIRLANRYGIGIDARGSVQRIHKREAARIGGVGVFLGFTLACIYLACFGRNILPAEVLSFWVTVFPVFMIGLIEDLSGRIKPQVRLIVTMLAAAMGIAFLHAVISRLDFALIDRVVLPNAIVAVGFTLIAAAGVPHAMNLIDGCNGLSASVGVCALLAIAVVAQQCGDQFVTGLALIAAAGTVGFLCWNFPFGKIFLGDAGAYWLGFMIAELSILLVARHPQVSPWFPMLLVIHPVWETLFSSYRRAFAGLAKITQPDRRHLHHLVYCRVVRPALSPASSARTQVLANSVTTVPFLLWALIASSSAVLWHDRPILLKLDCLAFVLIYGVSYRRLAAYRPRRKSKPLLAGGNPANSTVRPLSEMSRVAEPSFQAPSSIILRPGLPMILDAPQPVNSSTVNDSDLRAVIRDREVSKKERRASL